MSDFVPRDILSDLWDEILKRHWTFLETEESSQKLEERRKLEACLKEFLCIVQPDRKFFLPETVHVLQKSIREMDDFTAFKAITGFESISQYANNLFTKPWRKEYRVIKMYSGFFQHEIKSNLLDAEKLFEAMGYRQVSSEILVLDGPICPDQVTNVSRDAMAAYVECQIIKHIYCGVAALGLKCSWQDVFNYREKHMGGSTQAIKGMAAYALQDRRLRKEKQLSSENCYATIQHVNSPQVPVGTATGQSLIQQCQNCAPYHLPQSHHTQQQQMLSNGQCAVHSNNNSCAVHAGVNMQHQHQQQQSQNLTYNGNNGNSQMIASYPATNYQQHTFVAPGTQQQHHHMPHSRSLDHYNEPPPPLPHRHSFDHQQQGCMATHNQQQQHHYPAPQHLYEAPYDCIDGISMGGSSVSYAAVATAGTAQNYNYPTAYAHPYNVSGNRYPLPYNISNQLNSHYATPVATTVNCGAVGGANVDHYMDSYVTSLPADVKHNCNYHAAQSIQQSPLPTVRHHNSGGVKDFQTYRQRSFPPDQQLIDFDDRAPLTDHDFHAQLHTRSQNNSFDYDRERDRCERMYEGRSTDRRSLGLATGINRLNINATYAQPKDVICQKFTPSTQQSVYLGAGELHEHENDVAGNYIYARPRSKDIACGNTIRSERYAKDEMVSKMTDKYLRNSEYIQDYVDNNRKLQVELNDRVADRMTNGMVNGRRKLVAADRDTSDMSYESTGTFDDFINVGHSEYVTAANLQRSPTQASKNQDGVGSFESWDYVFQNLERSGYSKDLGERGDLLVQSLDLDSLNVPNANAATTTEKRRSSHAAEVKASRQLNGSEKSRTLEKATTAATSGAATTSIEKQREPKTTLKQEKSILKQTNSTASASVAGGKIKSALKSSASSSATIKNTTNNNNNGHHIDQQQNITMRNGEKSSVATTKRQTNSNQRVVKQAPVATQVIVTSPNEWSCRFCTFLNPDTKRICEMCSRSKDFNLDAVVSNTPTCV